MATYVIVSGPHSQVEVDDRVLRKGGPIVELTAGQVTRVEGLGFTLAVSSSPGPAAPVVEGVVTIDGVLSTRSGAPIAVGGVSQPLAITATVYDAAGNLTSITENAVTTTYTYDAAGNALTEARFGVTRTFSYNAAGDLTGAAL